MSYYVGPLTALSHAATNAVLGGLKDVAVDYFRNQMGEKKLLQRAMFGELLKAGSVGTPEEQAAIAPTIKSMSGVDVPTVAVPQSPWADLNTMAGGTPEPTQRYLFGPPSLENVIVKDPRLMALKLREPQQALAEVMAAARIGDMQDRALQRKSDSAWREEIARGNLAARQDAQAGLETNREFVRRMSEQMYDLRKSQALQHAQTTGNQALMTAVNDLDGLRSSILSSSKSPDLMSAVPAMIGEFEARKAAHAKRLGPMAEFLPTLPFDVEYNKPWWGEPKPKRLVPKKGKTPA